MAAGKGWRRHLSTEKELTSFETNGRFQKYRYPQIIHFNRVWNHYKPSILGVPVFLETSKCLPVDSVLPVDFYQLVTLLSPDRWRSRLQPFSSGYLTSPAELPGPTKQSTTKIALL